MEREELGQGEVVEDESLDADFNAIFGDDAENEDRGDVDPPSGGGEPDSIEGEPPSEDHPEEVVAPEQPVEGLEGVPDVAPEESAGGLDEDATQAPQRLNAAEKKIFANIRSKQLRKGIQRMVRDHESGQVKAINEEKSKLTELYNSERAKLHQQYKQELDGIQSLKASVEAYKDKLTFGGRIPLPQAVGELASTHAKLSSDDASVAIPEIRRIAGYLQKRFGKSIVELFNNAEVRQVHKSEEISGLQGQVQELQSQLKQLEAKPQVERIRREVDAVRQEKDATGRPLYPELHDVKLLVRVTPLVEQLMGANPELSYGDAFKHAVFIRRGQFHNQPAASPPAAQTQAQPKPSGVNSVRGKSAAPANGVVDLVKDAPKTGSIHDDWDYIRRTM